MGSRASLLWLSKVGTCERALLQNPCHKDRHQPPCSAIVQSTEQSSAKYAEAIARAALWQTGLHSLLVIVGDEVRWYVEKVRS